MVSIWQLGTLAWKGPVFPMARYYWNKAVVRSVIGEATCTQSGEIKRVAGFVCMCSIASLDHFLSIPPMNEVAACFSRLWLSHDYSCVILEATSVFQWIQCLQIINRWVDRSTNRSSNLCKVKGECRKRESLAYAACWFSDTGSFLLQYNGAFYAQTDRQKSMNHVYLFISNMSILQTMKHLEVWGKLYILKKDRYFCIQYRMTLFLCDSMYIILFTLLVPV